METIKAQKRDNYEKWTTGTFEIDVEP